jgi:hypothetical protein
VVEAVKDPIERPMAAHKARFQMLFKYLLYEVFWALRLALDRIRDFNRF